jgi:hypothetical protein
MVVPRTPRDSLFILDALLNLDGGVKPENAGKHPSVASLYRALAEDEDTAGSDDAQVIGPRRPVRACITGPGSGTDPALMERLTAQVLDGDTVLDDLARQAEDGSDDLVAQLLAQARNGDR